MVTPRSRPRLCRDCWRSSPARGRRQRAQSVATLKRPRTMEALGRASWGGVLVLVFVGACRLVCSWRRHRRLIAFFHPYCNDGGGGERVLWCAVAACQRAHPHSKVAIYTGDSQSDAEILHKAYERFGIKLPGHVTFVRLRCRGLIESRRYPHFTMLGQLIGGMLLAGEAILRLCPEVFVDSMGAAGGYPVAVWLAGCTVVCYVHYPTISTDMLTAVAQGTEGHNNSAAIAKSRVRTALKVAYYCAFALLYAACGRCAHRIVANSSWTAQHIGRLWRRKVAVLFPPCDTDSLASIPLAPEEREQLVVSIGQFRCAGSVPCLTLGTAVHPSYARRPARTCHSPEKNHRLQLESFATLLQQWPVELADARLAIIGACRNEEDRRRAADLAQRAADLGLSARVDILRDVPYDERRAWLSRAACGLHTMWMEHFGIGVVELMAAGVVPVAHASGGPLADIVVGTCGELPGRLATTPGEYADAMHEVLSLAAREPEAFAELQARARASASRFTDAAFAEGWCAQLAGLVPGRSDAAGAGAGAETK